MLGKLARLLSSPWLIAVVALFLRMAYLLYRAHLIPAEVLASAPFENEVGNVAAALAQGKGFCCVFRQPTGPTAWVAPVYPLLIAAVFKIFGTFTLAAFYAAVLLNCFFSALVCFPLYRIGRRVGSASVAILSSWVWVIFPAGVILPYAWIWDTSLSALLATLLLVLTIHLPDSLRPRDYVRYWLLWSLALLTNPSLGVLLPFCFAWIFVRESGTVRSRLKRFALAVAVIFLCCLPWTLRNYHTFQRFIPIRSNFAYEFWSGNNEIFDPESRSVNRITRYEQAHLYATLGETAFFDDKWQKAANFVEAHPRLYLHLCTQRVVATWFGTGSPLQDFSHADSFLARLLILWNAFSLLAMLVGLLRLARKGSNALFLIASFVLVFPIPFYLAHTSLRHRHPCDPVVALLMAVAILGPQSAQK